jgi:excisionase family DNA binding protein
MLRQMRRQDASDARNMINISYNESHLMQTVSDFTNLLDSEPLMTDLLTTKQVQTILRVDRTTIYRMVEAGQIPAVRVGKQWRFARTDVERWLQTGRYGALPSMPAERKASVSASAGKATSESLAEVLPVNCAQSAQDAFAELLGVTMVITDMQGRPVTQMSNPCGFVSALIGGRADAIQLCVATWQQMAGLVALEPKFALNEMGLMCARGLIRVGSELKGMVVIGGIAPENWPPSEEEIERLSEMFGVDAGTVAANGAAVFRMDRATQDRALRSVQRIADVFATMIQDRLAFSAQQASIA